MNPTDFESYKLDRRTTVLYEYNPTDGSDNRGYKIIKQVVYGTESKEVLFIAIDGESVPIALTRDNAINLLERPDVARDLVNKVCKERMQRY